MPKVVNYHIENRKGFLARSTSVGSVIVMPPCSRCERAGVLYRSSIRSTRCVRCIQSGRSCNIALSPAKCMNVRLT